MRCAPTHRELPDAINVYGARLGIDRELHDPHSRHQDGVVGGVLPADGPRASPARPARALTLAAAGAGCAVACGPAPAAVPAATATAGGVARAAATAALGAGCSAATGAAAAPAGSITRKPRSSVQGAGQPWTRLGRPGSAKEQAGQACCATTQRGSAPDARAGLRPGPASRLAEQRLTLRRRLGAPSPESTGNSHWRRNQCHPLHSSKGGDRRPTCHNLPEAAAARGELQHRCLAEQHRLRQLRPCCAT